MSTIRYIRQQVLKITQAEMASIAGVEQPTVSRWERDVHQPSLHHLNRIRTEALRRSLKWDDRWFFVATGAEKRGSAA
jgi:transcriptional regulator with XRE-family HTH domain